MTTKAIANVFLQKYNFGYIPFCGLRRKEQKRSFFHIRARVCGSVDALKGMRKAFRKEFCPRGRILMQSREKYVIMTVSGATQVENREDG